MIGWRKIYLKSRTSRLKPVLEGLKFNSSAAAVRGKQSPGKSDVAFVIKRTKKDAEGVRRSIEESKKMPIKMTQKDALALKSACST